MRSISRHRRRLVNGSLVSLLAVVALAIALPGCRLTDSFSSKFAYKYKIENYYIDRGNVDRVGRIVVVPFSNATGYSCASEEVTPVFVQELRKARKFDVIFAEDSSPSVISEKYANGSYDLSGYVKEICRAYGADGILVGEIKEYQGYKPFVLGLKFSLYTPEKSGAVWSVDETLDAGMKRVASSAREYYDRHLGKDTYKSGPEIMSDSPKMYAQFVCYSLISTLEDEKGKR